MDKVKLVEIKRLVKLGAAVDITNDGEDVEQMIDNDRPLVTAMLSQGVYGLNGAVLQGKSGKLYAITCRNTTLFRYV